MDFLRLIKVNRKLIPKKLFENDLIDKLYCNLTKIVSKIVLL